MRLIKDLFRAIFIKESVEIGDKFIYCGNDKNNPFLDTSSDIVEIVDKRNGYVKYKWPHGTRSSCKISVFRSMYKKKET